MGVGQQIHITPPPSGLSTAMTNESGAIFRVQLTTRQFEHFAGHFAGPLIVVGYFIVIQYAVNKILLSSGFSRSLP